MDTNDQGHYLHLLNEVPEPKENYQGHAIPLMQGTPVPPLEQFEFAHVIVVDEDDARVLTRFDIEYGGDFGKLAAAVHQSNVDAGWWPEDSPIDVFLIKLQLVLTEIAEATEGERKNLMDDHLKHRRMGEVELADAMIRLLDLAGREGWEYFSTVDPCPAIDMCVSVAAKHLFICVEVVDIAMSQTKEQQQYHYSTSINSILKVAQSLGYDVMSALFEKWDYNKQRADHKPEHRAGENGKKF